MHPKAFDWLLEPENPGVRYLTLQSFGASHTSNEYIQARREACLQGQIRHILDAMHPEGYWEVPGPGYLPKYRSTVWAVILLSQLGASIDMDPRIAAACSYLLENTLTASGQFTASGAASGTCDCLQGNLLSALVTLGCADTRLETAYEWMARTVTGEGLLAGQPGKQKDAPRYYAGKCGPLFACGSNNRLPCAWGGVKVMLAFSLLPSSKRTPLMQQAINSGMDFFFSVDPATASYPCGYSEKPSGNWWKFGFPVFYVTDLLQLAEALVRLGYGSDPRLAGTLDLIASKQDEKGHWLLEYNYTGKTWGDYGGLKQPNKWVTLRALNVLTMAGHTGI